MEITYFSKDNSPFNIARQYLSIETDKGYTFVAQIKWNDGKASLKIEERLDWDFDSLEQFTLENEGTESYELNFQGGFHHGFVTGLADMTRVIMTAVERKLKVDECSKIAMQIFEFIDNPNARKEVVEQPEIKTPKSNIDEIEEFLALEAELDDDVNQLMEIEYMQSTAKWGMF